MQPRINFASSNINVPNCQPREASDLKGQGKEEVNDGGGKAGRDGGKGTKEGTRKGDE